MDAAFARILEEVDAAFARIWEEVDAVKVCNWSLKEARGRYGDPCFKVDVEEKRRGRGSSTKGTPPGPALHASPPNLNTDKPTDPLTKTSSPKQIFFPHYP